MDAAYVLDKLLDHQEGLGCPEHPSARMMGTRGPFPRSARLGVRKSLGSASWQRSLGVWCSRVAHPLQLAKGAGAGQGVAGERVEEGGQDCLPLLSCSSPCY